MKCETRIRAEKAYTAGKRWCVIAQYEHSGFFKGEVLSFHKTYGLARMAAARSGYDSFRAVRELSEYIFD